MRNVVRVLSERLVYFLILMVIGLLIRISPILYVLVYLAYWFLFFPPDLAYCIYLCVILFLKTRLWKLRFVRPKRCFASRSWFSCVPFDLLWSPGLTFPWDLWARRCSGPSCGCCWGQKDPRVRLQWDTSTRPGGLWPRRGLRAGFGLSLTSKGWVFPLSSMCFIRITAGIPWAFSQLSNGWIWLLWQLFHTAEVTRYRQQRTVDDQPLPPWETQQTFSTRNKLYVPFQKHKFHVPEELALRPAELMDIVRVRTKHPRDDHVGNGHGSFSHLLPLPHLFPVLSKLCYCWTTRVGTFPSLQQEPSKFAGFIDH